MLVCHYQVHSSAAFSVMDDGSGIALHSGLSGRYAFLKNQNEKCFAVSASNTLQGKFSEQDLQQLLNSEHSQIKKLTLWLVENKFLNKC